MPTGRFSGWFDIGGRRLFLRCTGHRSPTVVFEGGLTTDWFALQNQLSGFTRVCSYDHPNGPWSRSDPAPTHGPPATSWPTCTLLRVAASRALCAGRPLQRRPVHPALCQHPPRQVAAGLVLIDAVHPAYHKRTLAMFKPLVPPEVWEALRQQAMAVPHRFEDPERVDIWTSERQTRKRYGARRCGRCRWSC